MEDINLKYFNIIEEKYNEYLQNKTLAESIEVVSDNKLLRIYQNKVNKLSDFASRYEKYINLIEENKILDELIVSESIESNKLKLVKDKESNLEIANEIFENLKIELFLMDKTNYESASVEIVLKTISDNNFVTEIKNMFVSFAKINNAKVKIIEDTQSECKLEIAGENIFTKLENLTGLYLKVEGNSESFATVMILKFTEQLGDFPEEDFEYEYFKSSGAGGQHINKTESAVRVIHKKTGLSVKCQDERSQLKNKERAVNLLKQKITECYKKFSENSLKMQRNLNKNAIFSNTPLLVFDFDKNIVQLKRLKTEYKLDKIMGGELLQISNDLKV